MMMHCIDFSSKATEISVLSNHKVLTHPLGGGERLLFKLTFHHNASVLCKWGNNSNKLNTLSKIKMNWPWFVINSQSIPQARISSSDLRAFRSVPLSGESSQRGFSRLQDGTQQNGVTAFLFISSTNGKVYWCWQEEPTLSGTAVKTRFNGTPKTDPSTCSPFPHAEQTHKVGRKEEAKPWKPRQFKWVKLHLLSLRERDTVT